MFIWNVVGIWMVQAIDREYVRSLMIPGHSGEYGLCLLGQIDSPISFDLPIIS